MKYGLDMLYPPLTQQAHQLQSLGWQFICVYVGGPRAMAHDSWHIQDNREPVRDIVKGGISLFLPIYVGKNQPWDSPESFTYESGKEDGTEATELTGACGFDRNTPLCLDMEYGTYQANPNGASEYIRGWVEIVNSAQHAAGLYSDIETLNHYQNRPDEIDFLWGASWVRGNWNRAPIGQFNPASPPPWDLWQFGGSNIAGISVDCNSAKDDFQFATYGIPI